MTTSIDPNTPTPEQVEDPHRIVAESTGTRDGHSGDAESGPANGDTETATDQANTEAQASDGDTNTTATNVTFTGSNPAVAEFPNAVLSARPINHADVARINSAAARAISSAFFMSNPKRIKVLEDALSIPVSDDKSFQMFYNHSSRDLECDASREARKVKGTPAEVTNVQIMKEAQARYFVKHGKYAIVNEEYMV